MRPEEQVLWAVVRSPWDGISIHPDEDAARDILTRKDRLFSFRTIDWSEHE